MFNRITLGPITIYMYGLMIAIGFASALFLCNYRGKKRGLSEDTIFGIFLCALIGGMVGCRLLYYIVELPAIMEHLFYGISKTDTSFMVELSVEL